MLHRLIVVGQITAKRLFTPAVELLRAFLRMIPGLIAMIRRPIVLFKIGKDVFVLRDLREFTDMKEITPTFVNKRIRCMKIHNPKKEYIRKSVKRRRSIPHR